jgi:hypothetical protein
MTEVRYEVEWSDLALEDSFTKVKSEWVSAELMNVARTSLDEHDPPDGRALPPKYWRRGLTVQRRAALDAAQSRGEDCDHGEQPWHYVLYYCRRPAISGRRRYVVLQVLSYGEVLASLMELGTDGHRMPQ